MTAPVISLTIQKEAPDMWYLKTEQLQLASHRNYRYLCTKVNYECIKSAWLTKNPKNPLAVVFVISN